MGETDWGGNWVLFWWAGPCSAAAKLLQSCDPIDGSPPGSPVPGILQARTLEWVAISFSNAWKWKVKVNSLSCVQLLVTPWTADHQAPPSMGFSRQEYWSGVPLPSPGAVLSKSLIQSSVDGWGCVPSLLFDLRPNYGGGNEDNGFWPPSKVPGCTQCPQPSSRPPTNPHLSPRLLDTHGQVNHYQPRNLVIPGLDIYPREKRVCINPIKYTGNIIAVLFVIVKTQKQLMSIIISMDVWYIHIMKYYPAIKQTKSAIRSMPIQQQKNEL